MGDGEGAIGARPFGVHTPLGITSRSKWASFSRNQKSCNSIGPRGPAVITFWLSATGQPLVVVSLVGLSLMAGSSLCTLATAGRLVAVIPVLNLGDPGIH